MKSRIFSLIIALVAVCNMAVAQYSFNLFEWENLGINYQTLLINNGNDKTARVFFKYDNQDVIIEYKVAQKIFPTYAPKDLVYEYNGGIKVIKGNANNLSGYIPDNIYLLDFNKSTNKGSKFVAIDNDAKGNNEARLSAPQMKASKYYKNYNELVNAKINTSLFFVKNEALLNSISASAMPPGMEVNPGGGASYISGGTTTTNSKVNVYVVLAGDVECKNIGYAVKQDLINMENVFKNHVAKDTRLNIKYTKISGSTLTKDVITAKLKEIGANNLSNDVVVFYYSGHGYNLSPMTSKFPRMHLNTTPTYNLDEIKKMIVGFNPRTTIVIGDLCNSVANVREKPVENMEFDESRGLVVIDTAKIGRLFIHSSGSIVSTSSSYNEYSYCGGTTAKPGGAFSLPFFKSFTNSLYKGTPIKADWKIIFSEAYNEAKEETKNIRNKNGAMGQSGFNEGFINYKF